MRCYLSGPMTGRTDHNYPAFHAAAADLRAWGFEVINPADAFDGDTTLPWSTYIREDIDVLLGVDCVAALPGWERSRGALLEVTIAAALDLPIFEARDPDRFINVDLYRHDYCLTLVAR